MTVMYMLNIIPADHQDISIAVVLILYSYVCIKWFVLVQPHRAIGMAVDSWTCYPLKIHTILRLNFNQLILKYTWS